MKGWFGTRVRMSTGAAAVVGIAIAVGGVGACSDDGRGGFEQPETTFAADASTEAAPGCRLQCSLDGRSVIEDCSGKIVQNCSAELACGAGACIEPCAAANADRSSSGCEFYFQPPRFDRKFPDNCYAAFVVNSSIQPAKLSLELEGKALDLSRSVFRTNPGSAELHPHNGDIAPGESVVVFVTDRDPAVAPGLGDVYRVPCPTGVVPTTFVDKVPDGTGVGSSFHLSSSVPVTTTTIYPFGGANSVLSTASLILPVGTWGKEHVLVNPWEAQGDGVPGTQIVASEDDTEVTLVPKRDLEDGDGLKGGLAGFPLTYRISKGQHLQFIQEAELSGSIVTSNKPTAVVGGHVCASIGTAACDILGQQIPAYEQWGAEYVGVGYRPRLGNEHEPMVYRLVAARDGTRLDYDPALPPGAPVTMSAGEVATFRAGTGDAFVVRTQDVDHPIYLAAYMTGGLNYLEQGDAEFVNVVPAKQYLSSYSFYADPSYDETSLVIVRAKSDGAFKDVWLECAGNLTAWTPIGTRGEYEFARVDLQRRGGPGEAFGTSVCQAGLQRMRSEGAFTATLWGWAKYASYAYPGGMAMRKLVDLPLSIR